MWWEYRVGNNRERGVLLVWVGLWEVVEERLCYYFEETVGTCLKVEDDKRRKSMLLEAGVQGRPEKRKTLQHVVGGISIVTSFYF